MKKTISALLSMLMLVCFALTACATEKNTNKNDTTIVLQIGSSVMTVNGNEMPIDEQGTAPVIINNRTLLPVRAVVEQMGGTVDWNGETQEVKLAYGEDEIRLTIESTEALLNGEKHILDVAPTVMNNRTLLPIRFIAEGFRFGVEWNEGDQSITITNSKTTQENTAKQPEEATKQTSKSLVVYFSATGNTKVLAEKIAKESGSDIFEIVPEEQYISADLNYSDSNCRANKEQNDADARPKISSTLENLESYDTVFIGYPIWWGTMPKIIHTFLDTYDLSGKMIMPFCTSGSSGISSSVSAIKSICTNSNVQNGFRGTAGTTGAQIQDWLNSNDFNKLSYTRMKLTANGKEITIRLHDNAVAKAFMATLPCTLTFSDFNNAEKIAYPAKELDAIAEVSGTAPAVGDLTLYKPWGNLALFYKNSGYSSDLIPIGQIEEGMENILLVEGSVMAEILR